MEYLREIGHNFQKDELISDVFSGYLSDCEHILCHCNMWMSTSRSMSCVHELKTIKILSPTKNVAFAVILRVRGQCASTTARILEELSTKHKNTMCSSLIPLITAWLELPGTNARPNLAPTRFTTALRTFAHWWHSKGKHISHFIAETEASNCPVPRWSSYLLLQTFLCKNHQISTW